MRVIVPIVLAIDSRLPNGRRLNTRPIVVSMAVR
jgi:hypothetical protein